MGVRRSFSKGV